MHGQAALQRSSERTVSSSVVNSLPAQLMVGTLNAGETRRAKAGMTPALQSSQRLGEYREKAQRAGLESKCVKSPHTLYLQPQVKESETESLHELQTRQRVKCVVWLSSTHLMERELPARTVTFIESRDQSRWGYKDR